VTTPAGVDPAGQSPGELEGANTTGTLADNKVGGGLGRYALRSSLTGLGTLLFILVFNFFLFRMLPGDPSQLYRGRNADAQQLAELRRQFHAPLIQQFGSYLKDPLSLHSQSFLYGQNVWSVIAAHLWPTILLLGTATAISAFVGVKVGIRSGWQRGSRYDKTATGMTLALWGVPEFWLGMMLLILFASGKPFLSIFPTGQFISAGVNPWSLQGALNIAWHLALPATALAVVYIAEYSLIMRSSIVDEAGQDYLTTGRAYGLKDHQVRRRHAVPNASLPTITLIFLNVGFIISGAVTVEYVFSWPGLGSLTVDALSGPDIPLLEALFLVFTISVLIATTAADIVVAASDPRIRV
jgi:peptide/nickel transport system permease protein